MRIRRVLQGVGVVWLASIAIVAAVTLPARIGRPDAGERAFEWRGAGAGIERLGLRGSAGSFRIVAGADDSVRVRLTVRGDDWRPRSIFSRSNPADLSGARLSARPGDGALALELDKGSPGRVLEQWTVEVPARLAASIEVGDGEIEVEGLAGGVEARANAGPHSKPGRIDVSVPAGSVRAVLGVGTVTVRTSSSDLGDVQLSAGVGDTELWIDGHRLERRDPPGSGSKVKLEREGAHRIEARVSVGDAVVRIR